MASHLQLRRQSLIVFSLLAAACSAPPPGLGSESSSGSSSDNITRKTAADGGSNAAGAVIVEADTACPKIDDDGETLVDGPSAPRFTHLGMVGTRRFAASEDELVVFDTNGDHASDPFAPTGTDLLSADSNGTTLGVVSVKPSGMRFTRYASDGSKTTSFALDGTTWMGDPGLAMASNDSSFFVVRANGTSLVGTEITGSSVGQSLAFAADTFGSALSVTSAHDDAGYVVVWAGQVGGSWRLNFMRWGQPKDAHVVLTSSTPLRVTKLVTTPSGFGLLMNNADVAALDDKGILTGSVHRYEGAKYTWDLAASGKEMALVAKRESGEPMLRTLDASGAPAGDWVCLDGSIGSQIGGAAVDADHGSKKWAVVHTTPKGAARLIRL